VSKPAKPKSEYRVDPKEIAKLSYEEASGRLESILDEIESGSIGLEDSVDAYKLGVALRNHCQNLLEHAEQQIRELSVQDEPAKRQDSGTTTRNSDDGVEEAPF